MPFIFQNTDKPTTKEAVEGAKKCTKQGTSYEIGVGGGLAGWSVQVVFLLHLLQVSLLLLSVQLLESLVRLVVEHHQIPEHKG